jgi:hypothetical protein
MRREESAIGTLCHETIYRYVYGPMGRDAGLYLFLPSRRRKRHAQEVLGLPDASGGLPGIRDNRSTFEHADNVSVALRVGLTPQYRDVTLLQIRDVTLLPDPGSGGFGMTVVLMSAQPSFSSFPFNFESTNHKCRVWTRK